MNIKTEEMARAERIFDVAIRHAEQVRDDPTGDLAACRDEDPELFFPVSDLTPTTQRQVAKAVAVCAGCPVTDWCRQRRYETGAVGVWAGVFYGSLGGLRPCDMAGCTNPVKTARAHYCGFECEHKAKAGTRAGYQLHRREGNDPCAACTEGNHRESAKWRRPAADGAGGARRSKVMHSGVRVASR